VPRPQCSEENLYLPGSFEVVHSEVRRSDGVVPEQSGPIDPNAELE
jgi:hypothetical protein